MKCSLIQFIGKKPDLNHKGHGLVFRSFFYLFQLLQQRQENTQFILKASFLEIYNEKVSHVLLMHRGKEGSSVLIISIFWGIFLRFMYEVSTIMDCLFLRKRNRRWVSNLNLFKPRIPHHIRKTKNIELNIPFRMNMLQT